MPLHVHDRVIPAPAGQPPGRTRRRPPTSGHPRTCGAARVQSSVRYSQGGSSPHLRGSRHPGAAARRRRRVIPAPAGQPRAGRASTPGGAGHPRTCGAAIGQPRVLPAGQGSSPHLRGSQRPSCWAGHVWRVIPAPAGQPSWGMDLARSSTGHPRTCGAALGIISIVIASVGSSPHLRGSPSKARHWAEQHRVIPAPAGQPISWYFAPFHSWGHPRTCGAATYEAQASTDVDGSSPHLRGSLHRLVGVVPGGRVIPAPAGQPVPSSGRWCCIGGHPRTCGAA